MFASFIYIYVYMYIVCVCVCICVYVCIHMPFLIMYGTVIDIEWLLSMFAPYVCKQVRLLIEWDNLLL